MLAHLENSLAKAALTASITLAHTRPASRASGPYCVRTKHPPGLLVVPTSGVAGRAEVPPAGAVEHSDRDVLSGQLLPPGKGDGCGSFRVKLVIKLWQVPILNPIIPPGRRDLRLLCCCDSD